MNYLAHLYIADRADADLAGAVLGDFVRGPDLSRFPDAVAHSIRLHRRIDTLTDQHELTLAAVARFAPGLPRRYAPIILDVVLDHVLATHWNTFSNESFPAFCRRGARAVAEAADWFDSPRRPTRTGFSALLLSYATETGIDLALRRVAHRLKRPDPMLDASRDWTLHLPALRADFPRLLDDLVQAARGFTVAAAP